jgi:Icc-related predicted phosphoesterase
MKIFVFTDSHGSKKWMDNLKDNAPSVDLFVCCGDFTVFEGSMPKFLKLFSTLGKPFIFIHGNHESEQDVTEELLNNAKYYENLHYIHKKSIQFENVEIFGYGGDGFSTRDIEFRTVAKQMLVKMKENKKNGIHNIMIFHGPPHKTKLDYLGFKNFCGNKDYRLFISHAPIDFAFCGHIHENFGRMDRINGRIIMNTGPQGKIIEVAENIKK